MAWGGVGGAAAAVVSKKRRLLVAAFERNEAYDAESARTLEELDVTSSFLFKLQQAKGVIVEVGDGRYFLDRVALARVNRTRKIIAAAVVAWLLLFLGVLWMLN